MFYKQAIEIGNIEKWDRWVGFIFTILLIFNPVFTEILHFEEKGMSFYYIQLLFTKLYLQINKTSLFFRLRHCHSKVLQHYVNIKRLRNEAAVQFSTDVPNRMVKY